MMPTQKDKVTTRLETISPEQAANYLKKNQDNRPMKDAVVRRLATAMRKGHWQRTHQGIAFNGDGRLLDGQHRLAAIVRADVSVQLPVTRGLSSEAFKVIDAGAARTMGDHFSLLGHKNAVHVAAALGIQWRYVMFDGDLSKRTTPEQAPDKADLSDLALEYPALCDLASRNSAKSARLLAPWSMLAFLEYTLSNVDSELAESYMQGLYTGAGLAEDSMILAVRNRLMSMSQEKTRRRGAWDTAVRAALIIKGWNRLRAGEVTRKPNSILAWKYAGNSAESFPLIR